MLQYPAVTGERKLRKEQTDSTWLQILPKPPTWSSASESTAVDLDSRDVLEGSKSSDSHSQGCRPGRSLQRGFPLSWASGVTTQIAKGYGVKAPQDAKGHTQASWTSRPVLHQHCCRPAARAGMLLLRRTPNYCKVLAHP